MIGAETFSRILDWQDRGTCVLFGDGAGAVVLSARFEATAATRRAVDASPFRRRGFTTSSMSMAARRSTGTTGHLRMEGREVFRQAVQHLAEAVDEALAANGLTGADIDWLVPHQANLRIIDAIGRKLGLERRARRW